MEGNEMNEKGLKKEEPEGVLKALLPDKKLCCKLYPHQREGVVFFFNAYKNGKGRGTGSRNGVILADEMGLGKSIQVILFLHGMIMNTQEFKNALLIVPAGLLDDWKDKLKKWTPNMKVLIYHHSQTELQRKLRHLQGTGGILLVSYRTFIHHCKTLTTYKGTHFAWDCLICDEAHKLKNTATKTHKGVESIAAGFYILITGTPMQNSLREFWSLFSLISDKYLLGTYKTFKNKFEKPIIKGIEADAGPEQRTLGMELQKTLKKITAPFYLRRTKEQIQDLRGQPLRDNTRSDQVLYLPKKNEYVIWIRITAEQEAAYRKIADDSPTLMLQSIHSLTAVCTHPRLNSDLTEDEWSGFHSAESGKLTFMLALLEGFIANGNFALVFSTYKKILDVIENSLTQTSWGKNAFLRIDGDNFNDRDKIVKKFQKRGSKKILLLTTNVGAEGLTLTAADCVVFADLSWNQSRDAQAVGRAHRIGQTKKVTTFRLITCGTLEEIIYRKQLFKGSLTKQVVGDEKNPLRYFTQDELKAMKTLQETQFLSTQHLLEKRGAKNLNITEVFGAGVSSVVAASVCGISDHGQLLSACQNEDVNVDMARLRITETVQMSQQEIEAESCFTRKQIQTDLSVRKRLKKAKIGRKSHKIRTPGLPRKYKCYTSLFSGTRKRTRHYSKPWIVDTSDSTDLSADDDKNLSENAVPQISSFNLSSEVSDLSENNISYDSSSSDETKQISDTSRSYVSDISDSSSISADESYSEDIIHVKERGTANHNDQDVTPLCNASVLSNGYGFRSENKMQESELEEPTAFHEEVLLKSIESAEVAQQQTQVMQDEIKRSVDTLEFSDHVTKSHTNVDLGMNASLVTDVNKDVSFVTDLEQEMSPADVVHESSRALAFHKHNSTSDTTSDSEYCSSDSHNQSTSTSSAKDVTSDCTFPKDSYMDTNESSHLQEASNVLTNSAISSISEVSPVQPSESSKLTDQEASSLEVKLIEPREQNCLVNGENEKTVHPERRQILNRHPFNDALNFLIPVPSSKSQEKTTLNQDQELELGEDSFKTMKTLQETQFSSTQHLLEKRGAKNLNSTEVFGAGVSSVVAASVCGISDHGQLLSACQNEDVNVDMARLRITETVQMSQQEIEAESCFTRKQIQTDLSVRKRLKKAKIGRKGHKIRTPGLPRKYKCYTSLFSGTRKRTRHYSKPWIVDTSDSTDLSADDDENLSENAVPQISSFNLSSEVSDLSENNISYDSSSSDETKQISDTSRSYVSDVSDSSSISADESYSEDIIHVKERGTANHNDQDVTPLCNASVLSNGYGFKSEKKMQESELEEPTAFHEEVLLKSIESAEVAQQQTQVMQDEIKRSVDTLEFSDHVTKSHTNVDLDMNASLVTDVNKDVSFVTDLEQEMSPADVVHESSRASAFHKHNSTSDTTSDSEYCSSDSHNQSTSTSSAKDVTSDCTFPKDSYMDTNESSHLQEASNVLTNSAISSISEVSPVQPSESSKLTDQEASSLEVKLIEPREQNCLVNGENEKTVHPERRQILNRHPFNDALNFLIPVPSSKSQEKTTLNQDQELELGEDSFKTMKTLQETQFSSTQHLLEKRGAKNLNITEVFGAGVSSVVAASVSGISDHGQLLSACQNEDVNVDMARLRITETVQMSQQEIEAESCFTRKQIQTDLSVRKRLKKAKIGRKGHKIRTPGLPRKYKCYTSLFSGTRKRTRHYSKPWIVDTSDSTDLSADDDKNLSENAVPQISSFNLSSEVSDLSENNISYDSSSSDETKQISDTSRSYVSDVSDSSSISADESYSEDIIHVKERGTANHNDQDVTPLCNASVLSNGYGFKSEKKMQESELEEPTAFHEEVLLKSIESAEVAQQQTQVMQDEIKRSVDTLEFSDHVTKSHTNVDLDMNASLVTDVNKDVSFVTDLEQEMSPADVVHESSRASAFHKHNSTTSDSEYCSSDSHNQSTSTSSAKDVTSDCTFPKDSYMDTNESSHLQEASNILTNSAISCISDVSPVQPSESSKLTDQEASSLEVKLIEPREQNCLVNGENEKTVHAERHQILNRHPFNDALNFLIPVPSSKSQEKTTLNQDQELELGEDSFKTSLTPNQIVPVLCDYSLTPSCFSLSVPPSIGKGSHDPNIKQLNECSDLNGLKEEPDLQNVKCSDTGGQKHLKKCDHEQMRYSNEFLDLSKQNLNLAQPSAELSLPSSVLETLWDLKDHKLAEMSSEDSFKSGLKSHQIPSVLCDYSFTPGCVSLLDPPSVEKGKHGLSEHFQSTPMLLTQAVHQEAHDLLKRRLSFSHLHSANKGNSSASAGKPGEPSELKSEKRTECFSPLLTTIGRSKISDLDKKAHTAVHRNDGTVAHRIEEYTFSSVSDTNRFTRTKHFQCKVTSTTDACKYGKENHNSLLPEICSYSINPSAISWSPNPQTTITQTCLGERQLIMCDNTDVASIQKCPTIRAIGTRVDESKVNTILFNLLANNLSSKDALVRKVLRSRFMPKRQLRKKKCGLSLKRNRHSFAVTYQKHKKKVLKSMWNVDNNEVIGHPQERHLTFDDGVTSDFNISPITDERTYSSTTEKSASLSSTASSPKFSEENSPTQSIQNSTQCPDNEHHYNDTTGIKDTDNSLNDISEGGSVDSTGTVKQDIFGQDHCRHGCLEKGHNILKEDLSTSFTQLSQFTQTATLDNNLTLQECSATNNSEVLSRNADDKDYDYEMEDCQNEIFRLMDILKRL